ncbi:hypothetical protein [Hylemonella gracilis]|uniref:hypothetical protein n=1 Tax=Hylemonella gracilis TaxID=80880 RepID=UPI001F6036A6|nr:hypothetical protein [Hylemonella gracilis]
MKPIPSSALIGALALLPCALAQAQNQSAASDARPLPAVTVTATGQNPDSGAQELRLELAAEQARTPGG